MTDQTITVPLYRLAHSRTGDKGNRSNISVIAFHPQLWEPICAQVTEAAVAHGATHIRVGSALFGARG